MKILWVVLICMMPTIGAAQSFKITEDDLYNYERGIEAVALKKYKLAWARLLPLAFAGHLESQYEIGFLYLRGNGVQRNSCAAVTWIDRAARGGFPPAQATMSSLISHNINGVQTDYKRAYGWLLMAVKNGQINPKINTTATEATQEETYRELRGLRNELTEFEAQEVEDSVKNGYFDLKTPVDVYIIPSLDFRYFEGLTTLFPACADEIER